MFPFSKVYLWRVKVAWTKWPRKGLPHSRKLPSKPLFSERKNKSILWLLTRTTLKQLLLLKQRLMGKVRTLNHVLNHFARLNETPKGKSFTSQGCCWTSWGHVSCLLYLRYSTRQTQFITGLLLSPKGSYQIHFREALKYWSILGNEKWTHIASWRERRGIKNSQNSSKRI